MVFNNSKQKPNNMKTLATILFITISTLTFSQNNSNQVNLKIESEDGINILKWESNREINTSYYLVEKSIDGGEYKMLGTQKAGSSTSVSYTHLTLPTIYSV